jgi:hypothetical protein
MTGGIDCLVTALRRGLTSAREVRAGARSSEHQLLTLQRLCSAAAIEVESARVGDAETVPAVVEALAEWPPNRS